MGEVSRIPTRVRVVSDRALLDAPAHSHMGPAARVLASHRMAEQASRELHDIEPGSGIKALAFASATHLALTIGADEAGDFFEMVARIAREVGKPPEDAA